MSETRVKVEGGKYEFIVGSDGAVTVLRYGDKWLTVREGGKAILALVEEHAELLAKVKGLGDAVIKDRLRQGQTVAMSATSEEVGWHPKDGETVLVDGVAREVHHTEWVDGLLVFLEGDCYRLHNGWREHVKPVRVDLKPTLVR